MQKRRLGTSGPETSALGIGAMSFGPFYGPTTVEDSFGVLDAAMELGQLHRSDIIIGADNALPPAAHPDHWAGQPGVRAPHLPIEWKRRELSTIDLFTTGFTLITEAPVWADIARQVSIALGVPLTALVVGQDVTIHGDISFAAAYGTGTAGASLVRPDGIISWHTAELLVENVAEFSEIVRQVAAVP